MNAKRKSTEQEGTLCPAESEVWLTKAAPSSYLLLLSGSGCTSTLRMLTLLPGSLLKAKWPAP